MVNYSINPPIFGILISNKLASFKDIKEYYTYEECLLMVDVVITDNYNQRMLEEDNAQND